MKFLSDSNVPPTGPEATHILQLISEEESCLADLERELAPVRALFERLERQHSKRASDLRKNKSIVNPVRRVPPEILGEIFLRVLDAYVDFDFDSHSPPSPITTPLILSQICSEWRQICIGFPRLWNHIIISFDNDNHGRMIPLVKLWLDRAQALPLSLAIRPRSIRPTHVSKMMDTLLSYLPQCKRLYIDIITSRLSEVHCSMGLLENLEVTLTSGFTDDGGSCLSNVFTAFEDAPRLKTVKVWSDSNFLEEDAILKLILPWPQLTRLEIQNFNFGPPVLFQSFNASISSSALGASQIATKTKAKIAQTLSSRRREIFISSILVHLPCPVTSSTF